jgi:HEAT repeat protein
MGKEVGRPPGQTEEEPEELVRKLMAASRAVDAAFAVLALKPTAVPALISALRMLEERCPAGAVTGPVEEGDALRSAVAKLRVRLCHALEHLNLAAHQAKPELLSLLESPDAEVRMAAADALGATTLSDPDIIRALLAHPSDPSAPVRAHCAGELRRIGAPAHVALWRLARLAVCQQDSSVRAAAAAALGSIAGRRALSLYSAAHDPGLRERAGIFLKRRFALVALRRACRDADSSVQHAAVESLLWM